MRFINLCNRPILVNPKLHVLSATCIWKPDMGTLPTRPLPRAGFFKTYIFRHLIIYLFNICLLGLKILGQEKILSHQKYIPPLNCKREMQCWTNVEEVWSTLYKCYTNVLCLLVYMRAKFPNIVLKIRESIALKKKVFMSQWWSSQIKSFSFSRSASLWVEHWIEHPSKHKTFV